ncbi:putative anoctamin-7 isoform X3, partial [Apostichopus japonicus]
FVGSQNRDRFFTNTDRIRVVNYILQNVTYGKRKRAEVGINRLVEEDVFQAAYPLHDGPEEYDNLADDKLNRRQVLRKYWARWGAWNVYRVATPSLSGRYYRFLYGIITSSWNVPANEICASNETYKMCPLCDEDIGCNYWYLSTTCSKAQLSYLFDHAGTVFFSIFMSFWAVTFLEYWKRKQASLAYHWDCMDFEDEEERPRPQFAAQAPLLEKNPITGILEPYFPEDMRKRRWLTGIGVLVGMVKKEKQLEDDD